MNELNPPNYSYQKTLIDNCYKKLLNNNSTVLAASCGAGKTRMSVEIIRKYTNDFPDKRVLILTHGQSVLRTQYYSVIKDYLPLEYLFIFDSEKTRDNAIFDMKIVITLPQAIHKKNPEELGTFGLIVVDEAHNYYLVDDGMVQSILSKTRHSCELLLTGSPSKFIAKNILNCDNKYHIESISSSELLENNVIIDPKVVLLKTKEYKFDFEDYFSNDELKKRKIDVKLTKDVIYEVVKNIHEINTGCKIVHFSKSNLKSIKKMMVVAIDEQHAFEICNILREIGLNAILSTYSFDSNSNEIENFKSDSEIQVIVVVQRGILGFNFPELQCVVDISLSLNPDRIFQMISRVVRISKNENKLFVKVMPNDLIEISQVSLSCACALSVKEVYETYSGNYRNLEIPIFNRDKLIDRDVAKERKEYTPDITYIPSFDVMTRLYKCDNENIEDISSYSWTNFEKTKGKILGIKNHWTLERCKIEALKFTTRNDWAKNSKSSYNAALRNNWTEECSEHMKIGNRGKGRWWTLERCKIEALKFSRRSDWWKNGNKSYNAALNNNWIEECSEHMNKVTRWTLENCKEEALKYNRPIDWCKGSNRSYNAALSNGWISDCEEHMKKITLWTLSKCKKVSLQFNSISDWAKNGGGSYNAAKKNDWLKECISHMEINRHNWTLETCKEIALKYTKTVDWRKNDCASYSAAYKNNWLKDCTANMKKRVVHDKWTKERCKEESLKYSRPIEWAKNCSGSYQAARKNNWFDECIDHMTNVVKTTRNHWNLENCKEEALKYNRPIDWAKNSGGSYNAAHKNDWLDECSSHMTKLNSWTLEKCKKEALKYNRLVDWHKSSSGSYNAARTNSWMNECTAHMKNQKKQNNLNCAKSSISLLDEITI